MIKVYGLSYCPWTGKAEKLLKKNKIKFKVILVSDKDKDKYKKKHDMKTFPQIFYRNKKIGGYEDLEELMGILKTIDQSNFDPTIISGLINSLKK